MLKKFDALVKHIKTIEGKQIAKDLRKRLKRSENYSNKLDRYFELTLDGMEPEVAKEEVGL